MAATLAFGLTRADRLLDRVSRSQTQLALVTRLEADLNALQLAPSADGSARLAAAIRAYRRTIDAEAQVLPAERRGIQIVDLEAQVAAHTASLAAIDANRRLFFAQVGHELRTPITVILGEAEVALRDATAPPARLREALGHVVANGQFVHRRLEDLLGLASAEDGRLRIASDRIDLAAVMQAAAPQAAPYARSSGIVIGTSLRDRDLLLDGDASWLQQALLALIDNALKHAGSGRIDMILARGGAGATLTVSDDGPGVDSADLPHLFDTYYQASARRGGSGLGLAVARWVAEAHRGHISADNVAGGGLSVRIDLPLAA